MLYSAVHKDLNYDKRADEIIMLLSVNSDFDKLKEYITTNFEKGEKRFVFSFEKYSSSNYEFFHTIMYKLNQEYNEEGWNVAFRLPFVSDFNNFYAEFKKHDIPFFFKSLCETKTALYQFIRIGVSDIYIQGELGFSLKDIHSIKEKYNINIRVIPDLITNRHRQLPSKMNFYILPQGIGYYAPYIDILEFCNDEQIKINLYMLEKWDGKIKDVINGFEEDYFCNTIPQSFSEQRVNCGLRCTYDKCQLCDVCFNISKTLTGVNLVITKEEDNNGS